MAVLGNIFQYEKSNYTVAEAMEEYKLAYEEEAYEDPGEHVPMGLIAPGGRFYDGNAAHWYDKPPPPIIS